MKAASWSDIGFFWCSVDHVVVTLCRISNSYAVVDEVEFIILLVWSWWYLSIGTFSLAVVSLLGFSQVFVLFQVKIEFSSLAFVLLCSHFFLALELKTSSHLLLKLVWFTCFMLCFHLNLASIWLFQQVIVWQLNVLVMHCWRGLWTINRMQVLMLLLDLLLNIVAGLNIWVILFTFGTHLIKYFFLVPLF